MSGTPTAPLKSLDQLDCEFNEVCPGVTRFRDKLMELWLSRTVGAVYYSVLAALVVISCTFKSVAASPGPTGFLGFTVLSVLSDSMESEIPRGSFVLIKSVSPRKVKVGDDITFLHTEDVNVTHRVVGIFEDYENSGKRAFETWGVDNPRPDSELVPAENVLGRVIFHSKPLGQLFNFINHNYLLSGFLCVLIFGFLFGIRFLYVIRRRRIENLELAEES